MIKADGYDYVFDSSACERCGGRCCTGESGYIFLTRAEAMALAQHLGLSEQEFYDRYLYKVGARYSIKEKPHQNGYACVFFDGKCSVYEHRPAQCRSFPFWEYFKSHKKELQSECPGIKFL